MDEWKPKGNKRNNKTKIKKQKGSKDKCKQIVNTTSTFKSCGIALLNSVGFNQCKKMN